MFCTNCGKHLSDDTRFCPHCGAPVNGVPDGAAKAPDSAAIKPKGDEPGKSAKKGVSMKAILLIGIVVCAAVFAVSRIFAGGSDAAGQLDGTYYLIGDGGSWLELDFHAKTVEMTVNGDTRECQYTGQFDPDTGELDLHIYHSEKGSILNTLFGSSQTTTTKNYFRADMFSNGDGSYISAESSGLYGSDDLYILIPESVYSADAFFEDPYASSAEALPEDFDLAGDWEDSWSERCCMTITADGDSHYQVEVSWSSSAADWDEWVFSGYFDPEEGVLSYSDGRWFSYSADESGNIQEGFVLDNMEGLLIYDDGILYWEDFTSPEYNCDFGAGNMRFVKVS